MRSFKIILRYLILLTWGLPYSLIGALIFLALLLLGKIKEVYIINGFVVGVFKDISGGISLGFFIGVSNLNSEDTLLHEMGHVRQVMVFGGLLFPLIIGIPSLIRCSMWSKISKEEYTKTGMYPKYDRIWFEGQASAWGKKYYGK